MPLAAACAQVIGLFDDVLVVVVEGLVRVDLISFKLSSHCVLLLLFSSVALELGEQCFRATLLLPFQ